MDIYTLPQNREQIANLVFGLNVWCWAVMVVMTAPADTPIHPVRFCIAAVHFVVGGLFLLRRPLVLSGSTRAMLAAIPSIVISGFAFACALPCEEWPSYATGVFVVGTLLTIASFLSLSQNFAVLPASRGVTRRGPYRIIRHPAYFGELILILACWMGRPSWIAATIFVFSVGLVSIRILAEEKLLLENQSAYQLYAKKVRYRLLPGVW